MGIQIKTSHDELQRIMLRVVVKWSGSAIKVNHRYRTTLISVEKRKVQEKSVLYSDSAYFTTLAETKQESGIKRSNIGNRHTHSSSTTHHKRNLAIVNFVYTGYWMSGTTSNFWGTLSYDVSFEVCPGKKEILVAAMDANQKLSISNAVPKSRI